MALDFRHIAKFQKTGLPFPQAVRRPDYRSSGPKRLLPQLQVKVPTLSTWGKKMAVVVDEDFFQEFGRDIQPVRDLSNAQVVWFIVRYSEQQDGTVKLERGRTCMTTLDQSIKGLVSAEAIPLPQFEEIIKSKLQKLAAEPT